MNYSKQRELILDVMRKTKEHPTAEMIYQRLKGDHPRLSLATVYRNLNQLCAAGILKKLHVADSPDRFDGNVAPHFHLACTCCGCVSDMDGQNDWRSLLDAENKNRVISCDVVFYGSCSDCIAQAQIG